MWSNKLNDTGLRAVTGSADFSARVWDALTGLELHQFPHKHIVRTVDFAHRSNRIVTGGVPPCLAARSRIAPCPRPHMSDWRLHTPQTARR